MLGPARDRAKSGTARNGVVFAGVLWFERILQIFFGGKTMFLSLTRGEGSSSMFETLEQRRLLSVTLNGGGMLLVAGTGKADHIVVSLSPEDSSKIRVRTRTETREFQAADVNEFRIE